MPLSVNAAIAQFRREVVDLNPNDVARARRSRDYLQEQIGNLSRNMHGFPSLVAEPPVFVSSGSFSRGTKIQPLDDIDFFVSMAADGLTWEQSWWDSQKCYLKKKISFLSRSPLSALAQLADDGKISSRRVLNSFKRGLATVPNYTLADIKRNGEALSFKLSSYPWTFDIIPAVPVLHWFTGRVDYYLMPNGAGNWMKSNPHKDTVSTTRANMRHNGLLLPVIRLIKYWNKYRLRQGLTSYYIETLCLNVFSDTSRIVSMQAALATFFQDAPAQVRHACPDPKGYGPNLDSTIDRSTKATVIATMKEAARNAKQALRDEREGRLNASIDAWVRIFGQNFPH